MKKDQFPCLHPGLCKGKQTVFRRPADLQRHYKNVHSDIKDSFPCDYSRCPRSREPFDRKDNYRGHLKYYHKEDLGSARPEKVNKRKEQKGQAIWQAEHRISDKWWRCARCLVRNYIAKVGWNCSSCKSPCEDDRRAARERGVTTDADTAIGWVCGACNGQGWIDSGYGAWVSCSSCEDPVGAPQPGSYLSHSTRFLSGVETRSSLQGSQVPEALRFERHSSEEPRREDDSIVEHEDGNSTRALLPARRERWNTIEDTKQSSHGKASKDSGLVAIASNPGAGHIASPPVAIAESKVSSSKMVDICDKLVSLLMEDLELRTIFEEAMQKASLENCENSLRRSLIFCSKQLCAQSSSLDDQQSARTIKSLATNTANKFGARMANQTEYRIKVSTYHIDDLGNEDSEDELDACTTEESVLVVKEKYFHYLEQTFQDAHTLSALRDSFRLFVYPDPVCKAILQVWPPSAARISNHSISYQVKWEVAKLRSQWLAKGQRLADVMTITSQLEQDDDGDQPHTQATSCLDYLSKNWPDLGRLILDGLETLFDGVNSGE